MSINVPFILKSLSAISLVDELINKFRVMILFESYNQRLKYTGILTHSNSKRHLISGDTMLLGNTWFARVYFLKKHF